MAKFNLTVPKTVRVVAPVSQVTVSGLFVDLDTGNFSVSINDGSGAGSQDEVRVSGMLNNGQLTSLTNVIEAVIGSFLGTTATKAP